MDMGTFCTFFLARTCIQCHGVDFDHASFETSYSQRYAEVKVFLNDIPSLVLPMHTFGLAQTHVSSQKVHMSSFHVSTLVDLD